MTDRTIDHRAAGWLYSTRTEPRRLASMPKPMRRRGKRQKEVERHTAGATGRGVG